MFTLNLKITNCEVAGIKDMKQLDKFKSKVNNLYSKKNYDGGVRYDTGEERKIRGFRRAVCA